MGTAPTTSSIPPKLILSRDEYHLQVVQHVKALNARLNLPSLSSSDKKRDKVLCYFMGRAAQIGEACFRISDLEMPLFVLARVLCEDFFRMYWATLSEQNADEYNKAAVAEMARMLKHNLKNKRAKVTEISSGKDVTDTFLPEIESHISGAKKIEKMAKDSGLSRVYDIVYRFQCLEVHANTIGLPSVWKGMDGVAIALSAINALLRAMLLVADNQDRTLTADEILAVLNLRYIPGT